MLVATAAGICFFGGETSVNAAPSFHNAPVPGRVATTSAFTRPNAFGDLKRHGHKRRWFAIYERPFETCNDVSIATAGWIVGLAGNAAVPNCTWPAQQWDPFAVPGGWLFP